jgi:hypothetical protein
LAGVEGAARQGRKIQGSVWGSRHTWFPKGSSSGAATGKLDRDISQRGLAGAYLAESTGCIAVRRGRSWTGVAARWHWLQTAGLGALARGEDIGDLPEHTRLPSAPGTWSAAVSFYPGATSKFPEMRWRLHPLEIKRSCTLFDPYSDALRSANSRQCRFRLSTCGEFQIPVPS